MFIVDTFHGFRNSKFIHFSQIHGSNNSFRFLGDTLSCCSSCWHGIRKFMAFCQIHGDTFSCLQFLFRFIFLFRVFKLRCCNCYSTLRFENRSMLHFSCLGDFGGTDSVLSSFRTDSRSGMIWYVIWMALVSRNSIRLALICVPPFGCRRLNTSCSLNSFFEIPWFDG
jgi:hypothetical protein